MAEIVTFGEAMVRLSPPQFRRLEQARSLDLQVGGAELNTAVALSRMGRSTAWVSRLTDNPLGRLIANHAREAGVDTSQILWTREDRVGLYFLEFGAAPRASSVLYDRKDAAIAKVAPGMVNWEKVFQNTRWFHLTGITPALSPSAAATSLEAIRFARKAGVTTSVDLNFRVKLWSSDQANRCMSELMAHTDYLITTEEDLERVFSIKGKDYEEAAALTAGRFPVKAVAITLRENPLVWRNTWSGMVWMNKQVLRTRTYEVEIVDRLGARDSFAAGFIDGMLDGDMQKALDRGVALSALKHSIPGDFAWITRDEVDNLLQGAALRIHR
ncbi:MAG: PfkB family carbohydrate kinase [Gemmataceae bacterium]